MSVIILVYWINKIEFFELSGEKDILQMKKILSLTAIFNISTLIIYFVLYSK
jgi:hypothetical protein